MHFNIFGFAHFSAVLYYSILRSIQIPPTKAAGSRLDLAERRPKLSVSKNLEAAASFLLGVFPAPDDYVHWHARMGAPPDARVLVWMHEHGGGADMGARNKAAQELGVSRDVVDVSMMNLVKVGFAGQPGSDAHVIGLTPLGREFLRVVLD